MKAEELALKTIKRVSLSEQVVNSVIQYIQENDLHPGDQLPTENEFSSLFGVSRTSVREAIKALGINGVLTSVPGKGTFLQSQAVALEHSKILQMEAHTTISDVMEVRTPLEIQAIKLAVERGTSEEIVALEEICSNYELAVEQHTDHSAWGRKFHAHIASMSANSLLINMLQSLSDITNRYRGSLAESDTEVEFYAQSHRDMCAAFRARDAEAAGREMARHMERTRQALQESVTSGNATKFIIGK